MVDVCLQTGFLGSNLGSNHVTVNQILDIDPFSSKEFFDIQATTERRLTLKSVRDMTGTYSQIHRTDKYSQHASIMWAVSLNG